MVAVSDSFAANDAINRQLPFLSSFKCASRTTSSAKVSKIPNFRTIDHFRGQP
jgi:hypothetical protein